MEIFQYDFMIRAIVAGTAIAITAPMVGAFLIVRRYSLMADTLSHVALLGVAVGVLLQVYPFLTAIILAIISSVFIEKLRASKKLPGDALLALFLTGSLALAIIIMGIAKGLNVNFLNFLFGNILTISYLDLYIIIVASAIVFFAILSIFKELFLTSLDEEMAKAEGVPTQRINLALVMLSALVIVSSIKVVGALLASALIVIPMLTATQLNFGFYKTVFLAILFSLFSVLGGIFLSWHLDLAASGTIVLLALFFFALTSIMATKIK